MSPVLVVLGCVLAVKRSCPVLYTIGWGDGGILILASATVQWVQHRPLLIGRHVGRHKSWGPQ